MVGDTLHISRRVLFYPVYLSLVFFVVLCCCGGMHIIIMNNNNKMKNDYDVVFVNQHNIISKIENKRLFVFSYYPF